MRIPPSKRATTEFFASWREALPGARKYSVAVRDYCMAKISYISGVRATELCTVRIGGIHWELGQWGRFVVQGKGARGSGPRGREAFPFAEGRELLWWYVEEIRGESADDPSDPCAPVWPSERLPTAVASLDLPVAQAVGPDAFRRSLKAASKPHPSGPVTELHPHLCGTRALQQVMPEPKPIWAGRCSHWMPVCSTDRIPQRTSARPADTTAEIKAFIALAVVSGNATSPLKGNGAVADLPATSLRDLLD